MRCVTHGLFSPRALWRPQDSEIIEQPEAEAVYKAGGRIIARIGRTCENFVTVRSRWLRDPLRNFRHKMIEPIQMFPSDVEFPTGVPLLATSLTTKYHKQNHLAAR